MPFLPRHLGQKMLEAAQHFKAILLLGARQTGKSTLLKHLLPHAKIVVFDPVQDIYDARSDPDKFLDLFPPPLILDEVQFAPELLGALKRRLDETSHMGQYYLTGSQNFSVLKTIAESMAGRIGIFHLNPFTPLEMANLGEKRGWLYDYLADPETFIKTPRTQIPGLPSLNEFLFRGTYPKATELPLHQLETFFLSYIQTYVERDVRLIENIENIKLFGDFLRLSAQATAQEINASHLGREIGISPQTARKWLNLLQYTYQWVEILPYHNNTAKRLSEKRKGYFKDTGIACHLMRIHSPETLVTSLKMGSLFETWVVNYILEQFAFTPIAECYHWRAHGGREVDLILERDGKLYPIEVKYKSRPNQSDVSGIQTLRETYPDKRIQAGLVIHGGEETFPIDSQTLALSWKAL